MSPEEFEEQAGRILSLRDGGDGPSLMQRLGVTDDELDTKVWTIAAEGHDCPMCGHGVEMHDGQSCTAPEGYDHLNGFHECGCPLTPPAEARS